MGASDFEVGMIFGTNNCGDLVVVDYASSRSVTVKFLITGSIHKFSKSCVQSGRCNDKMALSVFGVGALGSQTVKTCHRSVKKRSYSIWYDMLRRCYAKESFDKWPAYRGCTVCGEWLIYEEFEKWYDKNYPKDGQAYELDKDIVINGNKEYSPEACIFVSHAENMVKAHATKHRLINPSGEIVEVYNLRKFCRDNNIDRVGLYRTSIGAKSDWYGWQQIKGDK